MHQYIPFIDETHNKRAFKRYRINRYNKQAKMRVRIYHLMN